MQQVLLHNLFTESLHTPAFHTADTVRIHLYVCAHIHQLFEMFQILSDNRIAFCMCNDRFISVADQLITSFLNKTKIMCFGKFCQYKPRISHGWSFPCIQSFYHIQIGVKLASQNKPEIRCNLFCCLLNLKILLPDLFHRCLKHPSSKMRSCENRPHSIVIFHLKDLFCDFNRIRTIIHMRNNMCVDIIQTFHILSFLFFLLTIVFIIQKLLIFDKQKIAQKN